MKDIFNWCKKNKCKIAFRYNGKRWTCVLKLEDNTTQIGVDKEPEVAAIKAVTIAEQVLVQNKMAEANLN